MPLIKTEKALAELRSRQRTLGLKERALLLLADGQKSAGELQTLVQADAALVHQLVADGYLTHRPGPETHAVKPLQVSADPFHGKRSLATARLYLLDLVERMFARPDPAFAHRLRELLLMAPDQEAVVAASHTLLQQVETVAGLARADGIRERLDRLWPTARLDVEIS